MGSQPADLDDVLSHPFRTRGTFGGEPNPQETNEGDPLIALSDVKPGDFGELTLSFHICGNPGFVWLTGALRANDENTVNEPEANDPDENNEQTATPISGDGELLDAIQTRVWYDDGDNVKQDDELYLTPQLSLGELLLFLAGGRGALLCSSGAGVVVEPPDEASSCHVEKDYDSRHQSGDTVTVNTPLTGADVPLEIPKNPKCTDFGLLEALKIGPGEPGGELPNSGTSQTYQTPYGDIEVTRDGETVTDWEISGTGDNDNQWCIAKVLVKGGNQGGNVYSYDNGDGDDDFTDDDEVGAKSDHDTSLETPTGQDISHVSFCVRPDTAGD
ncbi:MAG: hypothetical protein R3324_15380, partial [Halobacteriales archaeon]|nr:hypothetical protein [Halobacteriales archaeon]